MTALRHKLGLACRALGMCLAFERRIILRYERLEHGLRVRAAIRRTRPSR